jgi:hypothetical protein
MAGDQRPFSERRFAMAATSDWRLYQLYMEFGEAQDRRARPSEAADAYALALYFARRLNDPARIHECRQLMLERNPNHVAGQAVSAPLFFAQLLMRYPADEVEMMLTSGKPEASGPTVAVAEEEPVIHAQNARTFRQAQSVKPSYESFARSHHHHSEPAFDGMARARVRPIIEDDVLLADAGLLDDDSDEQQSRRSLADLPTAAKALAAGAIASGLLLIAYLGYSLYPVMHRLDAKRGPGGGDAIVVTEDDPPRVNDSPQQPDPPPNLKPKTPRAIAKAGANTPISLSSDPPPKLSARPAEDDDSSQK